jgi:hypothetical protein
MKTCFVTATLVIACCTPVFAPGAKAATPPPVSRIAGSVVNTATSPRPLPGMVTTTSPLVASCSLESPAFRHCLAANATSLVKQPDDPAAQVFQFKVRTSDGSIVVRTVLATADTTEAAAAQMALADTAGGTILMRL